MKILEDLSLFEREAENILRDPSHHGHSLFELLPSGRRLRTLKAQSNRLKNSFYG